MSEAIPDWKTDLEAAASGSYSAGGEDGVLRRIFERIGSTNRFFVEFGAWDGRHESNTALLRLHHGWSGLLMEGSDRADGSLVRREFVTPENVEALFRRYDVPRSFDLLSIDIDGQDYWVWKAIERWVPRVVIVEYNIFFQPDCARTVAYDVAFRWDRERHQRYHGASLAAFEKLARRKGYRLVWTEPFHPNAIFVRDDALPAEVDLPEAHAWTRWGWPVEGYVEPSAPPSGRWVDV